MSFWRDRNVLVTGCTGFLGLWLTRDLIERGANVVGLVRDSVPKAPFFAEGVASRIAVVRGEVGDGALLERLLNDYEIEVVFHLAAQAIVTVANRNPHETFETNIRGTWTVLEAVRRNSGSTRVVVASSDKAYGIHEELPYTEDLPLRGMHPYDVSKSCADLISIAYHRTYGVPVCVTRCANLFGPGDLNFSRLVPGTIRSALLGERPVIRSDGSPVRDYVYVKDVAEGYLSLAEAMEDQTVHGQAFNLGSGEPVSVVELTRWILTATRREDLVPLVRNEAKAEILRQYLSSELAKTRLGWRPGRPVKERLAETVEWYRGYLGRVGA